LLSVQNQPSTITGFMMVVSRPVFHFIQAMPLICANGIPAGKAIAGNKQKNDPLDAETIAHLMRGASLSLS
jgi:hypothetical protein